MTNMDLKEDRIVLFINPDKTGPTYTGEAQSQGIHFSIAIWTETSKKGVEYLSGKIEPWHPKGPAQPPPSDRSFPEDKPAFREQPVDHSVDTPGDDVDDLPF
jgi:hypothetical protein